LEHGRILWGYWPIFVECILLAPLLALFILRRFAPAVVLYAVVLSSNLVGRVYQLVQYYNVGPAALVSKIDTPDLLLMFLGGVSITVVLVWAAIHFVVFVRHALKSNGPAS
jgi:hypothetical protein